MPDIQLQPSNPNEDRSIDVAVEGDDLVITTTVVTKVTLSQDATAEDMKPVHRANLEAYADHLGLDLNFANYPARGDLINAIIEAREVTNG